MCITGSLKTPSDRVAISDSPSALRLCHTCLIYTCMERPDAVSTHTHTHTVVHPFIGWRSPSSELATQPQADRTRGIPYMLPVVERGPALDPLGGTTTKRKCRFPNEFCSGRHAAHSVLAEGVTPKARPEKTSRRETSRCLRPRRSETAALTPVTGEGQTGSFYKWLRRNHASYDAWRPRWPFVVVPKTLLTSNIALDFFILQGDLRSR